MAGGSPLRGLTTRGRCLVAAGVAAGGCAVILDERDLLRVAALLVALPVLTALLLGLSRLRLEVTREVAPRAVSVGAPAEVTLTLRARSRLPVAGMLLSDAVPPGLGDGPRYAVGALAPGTVASVRYRLDPRVRGRHRLGPAQVQVADPLGLVELTRPLVGSTQVLVRPQLLELGSGPHDPSDAAESGGAAGGAGAAQQNRQDALVRPYRDGDDLRSVHWRSSARRDELMVRPQEQSRRAGTVVLLDVRARAHHGIGPHATLERAVSLAASAAVHLGRRDRPTRLITSDGVDLGGGDVALDQLALLQPSSRTRLTGVAEATGQDELVAVLGAVDDMAAAELISCRTVAAGRAVVFDPSGSGIAALRAAGWVVVVADERTPLPRVWQQLGVAQPMGARR